MWSELEYTEFYPAKQNKVYQTIVYQMFLRTITVDISKSCLLNSLSYLISSTRVKEQY